MDREPFLVGHDNKGRAYQHNTSESILDSTPTPILTLNNYDIKNSAVLMDFEDRRPMNSVGPHRLQHTLVVADGNADSGVKILALKENIFPSPRPNQDNYSDSTQQEQDIEQKNSMLLNYLDRMKRRRLELQALKPRPAWALLPVARIHHTSHATDEESKRIGNVLDDFFNQEIRQDTVDQYGIKDKDILVDLSSLEDSSPSNVKFHGSAPSSPLLLELPVFKYTPISLMLEELTQGSKSSDPGRSANQSTGQTQQPVNFLSLNDKLRKKIWTLALQRPSPRIIELRNSNTHAIVSRAAIPALLHTCRESRAIAKESYDLSFSTDSTSPKVYFNFKHDWVYTRCSGCLGNGCGHKLTLTNDHKKLKHLIFEGPMSFNPFPKILRFYPRIENLILIGGKSAVQRDQISKEDITFVNDAFDWAREEGLMALAKKAWRDLEPSGEKPLLLKHIWRATLPGVIDNVKRNSDPAKGLWTCCC